MNRHRQTDKPTPDPSQERNWPPGTLPSWNQTNFKGALPSKAAEDRRTPRRWRAGHSRSNFRQVLECAAPAALWISQAGSGSRCMRPRGLPACRAVLLCGHIQFCKTVTNQTQRFRQIPDESLASRDTETRIGSNTPLPSALKKRIAMKTTSIVLLAVLLTGSAHVASAADDLSAALQKGLLEEEANHNLDAAIQAYQSVVDQFGDQRKIAATAVFRLGECYRKQGKTNDAVLQYQRLLADFADQASLIGPSEKNLAALGQASRRSEGAPTALVTRTVTDPDQLNLLKEEIMLVQGEIAGAEAKAKVGRGDASDISKSKKALLELQRQLPENAAAASQKGLIERQIQLVEQLLANRKAQIAIGAAPPLDSVPFERELLGLKRELIAVTETPSKASGSFSEHYQRLAEANKVDEETKAIQRYKALAQNSPDLLNAKDQSGSTPLHHSAARGELAVAKFLLANGADINSKDTQGFTPLYNAARFDQKPMVELLLTHHAEVNVKSWGGLTPLHHAASKGFLSVAETLLANGADPNAEASSTAIEPLVTDARFGQPDQSYFAATALHYAAGGGHLAIVRLLLDHKADVNAKSKGGQTPLFAAVEKNRLEVAKLLLANQASPNVKANFGATLFGVAIQNQNLEMVKLLLTAGADINVKGIPFGNAASSTGNVVMNFVSPLAYAASKGDTGLADFLLKNRADLNSQDGSGNTPLNLATQNGQIKMVERLLENGADPNLKNRAGDTPLHLSKSKEISELLLAGKADVNAKNEIGRTPLHNAADAQGTKELVELLLSKVAEANAVDGNGQSPLFLAVMALDKEKIQLLIAHGADVKAKDKSGRTPLGYISQWAQATGFLNPVPGPRLATPVGVPINRTSGRQPASPPEVAEILRQHGATE